MIHFLQILAGGVLAGTPVALLALGISLIYRTTGILNLSHGALAALGAYIMYSASKVMPMVAAVALAIAVTAVVGALIGAGLAARLNRQAAVVSVVATLAIGVVIGQIIQQIWGSIPVFFPNEIGLAPVNIGSVGLNRVDLWALCAAAALSVLLAAFLRLSRTGLSVRAVSDDVDGARLSGIQALRIRLLAWAIASGLAVIAGFFIASSAAGFLGPQTFDLYLVAALLAAVIGGVSSLTGTVAGAILLWTAQSVFQNYAPTFTVGTSFVVLGSYTNSFFFVILIAVLLAAPSGLFGARRGRSI
ncbi:MAG TPA: branched-chain amino acid ABC transporter permease [Chloroflexota bacterium]|jgi:branched-chain amino acid transport system permease protein|nr:branched-chain amino acid ABC transporter permease [Chloroflexota bacterium]